MYKRVFNPVAGITCVIVAVFLTNFDGARAQQPDPTTLDQITVIEDEIGIMGRVLQSGLREAGFRDWEALFLGGSLLRAPVDSTYLPTVGAIFELSVNFPLKPAVDSESAAGESQPEEDLWEREASGGTTRTESPARYIPTRIGSDSSEAEISREDEIDGQTVVSERFNLNFVEGIPKGSRQGFTWNISVLGNVAYNEEKAERFVSVLIDLLAEYGYRMAHLAPSDRVMIVLNAPRAGHDDSTTVRSEVGRVAILMDDLMKYQQGARSSSRDRVMLSIPKSALTDALEPEDIEQHLTRFSY